MKTTSLVGFHDDSLPNVLKNAERFIEAIYLLLSTSIKKIWEEEILDSIC